MPKIQTTDFGDMNPEALGFTKPMTITYDPAGGVTVDRLHPPGTYAEAEMKPAKGGEPIESVPFELAK